MRVSEVTLEVVKEFCGVSDNDSDALLTACISAAKSFVVSYTGLSAEEIDNHEDITTALLVLIYNMYADRDYTTANDKINPLVQSILALHSGNVVG